MSLQQLLDDDQDPGNTREEMLTASEREDIQTAICLIDHLDSVYNLQSVLRLIQSRKERANV